MEARPWSLLCAVLAGAAVASPAARPTLVVCAPGYPGSSAEAQPTMDAFAGALSAAAGLGRGGLAAVYFETEAAGLERLSQPDAALALVPLPFLLKHEATLALVARAAAVPEGREATEVWSLVAGKGRVASAEALEGFELVSLAAYAPRFVRGPALGAWGRIPAGTRLVAPAAVLSSLRKAATGEKVALLLDGGQAASLASLPFAGDLEVVARSAALPAHVLCFVGERAAGLGSVVKALLELRGRPGGPEALGGLRLERFAPIDEAGLKRARAAYAAVKDPP